MSEFCAGCGKDMWEYDEPDWCIDCAPELFDHTGSYINE